MSPHAVQTTPYDRNLALELVRVTEAGAMGRSLGGPRRQGGGDAPP